MQRRARGRGDRVEDAEQRVAVAVLVAGDQRRVVEVVAGVEPHALRQPPPQRDLAVRVEQRDLDAVDAVGVRGDDVEQHVGRLVEVGRAPVTGAAPDRTCRRASAGSPAARGPRARRRRPRGSRRRCARRRPARGWPSRSPARPRPPRTRTAPRTRRGSSRSERGARVVGRGARREPAAARARLGGGAADQLARGGPVEPHPALRRVHRLGDAEAVRPQVAAERERRLPVEHGRAARLARQRVGDHVRGGERDARRGRRARRASNTRGSPGA